MYPIIISLYCNHLFPCLSPPLDLKLFWGWDNVLFTVSSTIEKMAWSIADAQQISTSDERMRINEQIDSGIERWATPCSPRWLVPAGETGQQHEEAPWRGRKSISELYPSTAIQSRSLNTFPENHTQPNRYLLWATRGSTKVLFSKYHKVFEKIYHVTSVCNRQLGVVFRAKLA